jgi:hypothetical protein
MCLYQYRKKDFPWFFVAGGNYQALEMTTPTIRTLGALYRNNQTTYLQGQFGTVGNPYPSG